MRDNFKAALARILVHEGGYVDHPRDPGGATNKGVTLATFRRFYGKGRTKADLRRITDAQVAHIYKSGYWDKVKGDDLPAGVDYVMFDQAINSTPGRAARWLQKAVGATEDGRIGPATLERVRAFPADETIKSMGAIRLDFMKRARDKKGRSLWETFGRGWGARVEGVTAHGIIMANQPRPVRPAALPQPERELGARRAGRLSGSALTSYAGE